MTNYEFRYEYYKTFRKEIGLGCYRNYNFSGDLRKYKTIHGVRNPVNVYVCRINIRIENQIYRSRTGLQRIATAPGKLIAEGCRLCRAEELRR